MHDHDMPQRCWCGRTPWDGHRHFGVAPVEFGRSPIPKLSLGERALMLLAIASGAVCIFFLSSCATLKTCAAPMPEQAITDAAAVLACAAKGDSLATCEKDTLATEGAQLTTDLLMCGETAVVNASKGSHVTDQPKPKPAPNIMNTGNPADYPPLNDNGVPPQ